MKRIHIVGEKDQGKTTLLVALVAELSRRGVVVGTIKHSPHAHEPDVPGKDTYRHREAGARAAALVSQSTVAVFANRQPDDDPYRMLTPAFADCQLVLVEGDTRTDAPKVEVWRSISGRAPLAADRDDIVAVISDDPVGVSMPVWPRSDISELAEAVLKLVD